MTSSLQNEIKTVPSVLERSCVDDGCDSDAHSDTAVSCDSDARENVQSRTLKHKPGKYKYTQKRANISPVSLTRTESHSLGKTRHVASPGTGF